LVQRINSDLANDLGNLFARTLTMAQKYFSGAVPRVDPKVEKEMAPGLKAGAEQAIAAYEAAMEEFAFHKALLAVWEFISQMNKYIDTMAPWELAKKESSRKELEAVIYNLLEGLRIVSGLIYPVMPSTAVSMQKHLGLDCKSAFYELDRLKTWNGIAPGTRLLKSVILFPRIDVNKQTGAAPETPAEKSNETSKPQISIDEFARIDLRVATVVKAEAVPRAKKLLKLEVDLGDERRTVVAGIAGSYAPDDLVDKQIVIVANLKPAKLMGILSQGMLLAAVDKSGPILAVLDQPVKPGTRLK
jgi:methionyl-tRNA synthetase